MSGSLRSASHLLWFSRPSGAEGLGFESPRARQNSKGSGILLLSPFSFLGTVLVHGKSLQMYQIDITFYQEKIYLFP
jgi:hypothetical protein